jgi:hypothetical protein
LLAAYRTLRFTRRPVLQLPLHTRPPRASNVNYKPIQLPSGAKLWPKASRPNRVLGRNRNEGLYESERIDERRPTNDSLATQLARQGGFRHHQPMIRDSQRRLDKEPGSHALPLY